MERATVIKPAPSVWKSGERGPEPSAEVHNRRSEACSFPGTSGRIHARARRSGTQRARPERGFGLRSRAESPTTAGTTGGCKADPNPPQLVECCSPRSGCRCDRTAAEAGVRSEHRHASRTGLLSASLVARQKAEATAHADERMRENRLSPAVSDGASASAIHPAATLCPSSDSPVIKLRLKSHPSSVRGSRTGRRRRSLGSRRSAGHSSGCEDTTRQRAARPRKALRSRARPRFWLSWRK